MEPQVPESPLSAIIKILSYYMLLHFLVDLTFNIFLGKSIFSLIYHTSKASKGLLGNTDTSTLKFLFCTSVAITAICWISLFTSRFLRPAGAFIMPFRFEIILVITSIIFHLFSLSCIHELDTAGYMSWDRDPETSRLIIYGFAALLSWMMAGGWLGFVRLAFFGSEKERHDMDVMMRAYTFMKLPHEK